MVSKDDEIDLSRLQDQSLAGQAKREAAERKRILKIFSKKALQARLKTHALTPNN